MSQDLPAGTEYLQNHVVARQLGEILGDLALAESVIKRVVNHLRCESVPRGLVTIDFKVSVRPSVCWSVATSRSSGSPLSLARIRRPLIELLDVCTLKCVLELCTGCAAADADILRCLKKEARTFNFIDLATQARDDLISTRRALVTRLQGNEHAAGIGRIAFPAHEHRNVVDRGIFTDDFPECELVSPHLIGEVSCAASEIPVSSPISCCGKKPLGITTKRTTESARVQKKTMSVVN